MLQGEDTQLFVIFNYLKWKSAKIWEDLSYHFRWNNEEDCVKYGGQWYEFYDYKNILSQITSAADCTAVGTGIDSADLVWGYPKRFGEDRHNLPEEKCLVLPDALDCQQAPWTRANHLGNAIGGEHAQVRD